MQSRIQQRFKLENFEIKNALHSIASEKIAYLSNFFDNEKTTKQKGMAFCVRTKTTDSCVNV